MTHLILTVGRNELPVLAAAYRLCAGNPLPRISVLHSLQTVEEAGRVRRALEERLRVDKALQGGSTLDWVGIEVDEADPPQIRRSVREIVDQALLDSSDSHTFHLHHTGGTSAMGVYALQSLLECQFSPGKVEPRFACGTSYLAGKDQQVRDNNGSLLTPPGADERSFWNLTIEQLSRLHGYSVTCRSEPSAGLLGLCGPMSVILIDPAHSRAYNDWLRGVWEEHKAGQMIWPEIHHADWSGVTQSISTAIHPESGWLLRQQGRWVVDKSKLHGKALRHVDDFLHHQCLELFAFRELTAALSEVCPGRTPHVRHSMTAQQPGKKTHEVDVVAVCGYQLLAVSCSFSTELNKLKAFEVMHRARQVGGSHARALLLCAEEPGKAELTTDELRDDVASPDYFVEIWGRDLIEHPGRLREAFREYLSDAMRWNCAGAGESQ